MVPVLPHNATRVGAGVGAGSVVGTGFGVVAGLLLIVAFVLMFRRALGAVGTMCEPSSLVFGQLVVSMVVGVTVIGGQRVVWTTDKAPGRISLPLGLPPATCLLVDIGSLKQYHKRSKPLPLLLPLPLPLSPGGCGSSDGLHYRAGQVVTCQAAAGALAAPAQNSPPCPNRPLRGRIGRRARAVRTPCE